MSVHDPTFQALKEMGIEPILAREAATRFHSVEPAVNWCFGDGQLWQPPDEVLPPYESRKSSTTIEHNEVRQKSPDKNLSITPRLIPQSNNPFLPKANVEIISVVDDDDEDDDLRKALALSREGMEVDDEQRQERARSVRAHAPPPSPDIIMDDESKSLPTFGPSNKDDKEGNLAMVPVTNTEEDDLNRAIQDSLMTASFHSASAMTGDKPVKGPRQPGAPPVFYSSVEGMTYGANLLQSLWAIPQIKEIIVTSLSTDVRLPEALRDMYTEAQYSNVNFVEAQDFLKLVTPYPLPQQLPPSVPNQELRNQINDVIQEILELQKPNFGERGSFWAEPPVLFTTILDPYQPASDVSFPRGSFGPSNIYSAMADALWAADTPNQSVVAFGEVLAVYLNAALGERTLWEMDERVVLDRFLKVHATRSTQIRAQQSLAKANVKRLKEKLEEITTFKDQNTLENISVLIKHLESSPLTTDEIQAQTRAEMKAKLENILQTLTTKVDALKMEMEQENVIASGDGFHSEELEMNKHIFLLRAVLFYDGALVGQRHLYSYVKEGDDWWKVQEAEATKVDWNMIKNDQTGLYLDAGPYMLLYSREGPRPHPTSLILAEGGKQGGNDISEGERIKEEEEKPEEDDLIELE
ncbi:hypothetical protein TREMEDRAFT_59247 [Tremella mesenterica DSM 1558]|uniref:uncharacterized protein n=1 Tax=Tremella mesenterica (strain ATCC 24925 / CBS 8224 / DSM 1558 / NBRC 9311 / NRRL Y-6157 / RJB 2259-6 / UBC 559-6) TaxID=578456 RepID=UPI0003F4A2F3|nr:uncharacterized protein TREMEDRAFT_59247 [Tremella mesenterica DSM 1558]EIW73085.1 hypothetical protein TREMEDRAFT_59247 [Tremella mesenterica DSM 1558]